MSRTHRRVRSAEAGRPAGKHSPLSTLLAALVCLAITLALAPTLWLSPRDEAHATSANPLARLTVTTGEFGVVTPGTDVTFTVVVRRTTAQPLGAGRVQIRLDRSPLPGRAALATWLTETDPAPAPTGQVVATAAVRATTGSQVTVNVTVPASILKLAAGKVYPVEAVYSLNADAQAGTVAASTRTTVISGIPGTANTLAVVAPLTVPSRATGVVSADELATLTAADGELTARLTALQHRPVAIGLDPIIPASIRLLGDSAPRSAIEWLDRLEAAPNEVFALQYADADIAGQSQAGIGPLQPTSFEFAIDDSLFREAAAEPAPSPSPTIGDRPERPTVETLTAWPYTLSGIGWPAENTVVAADLEQFATAGLDTTILDASAVTGGTPDSTAGAHARIGDHQVLVADGSLTTALRTAASAPTEAVWIQSMADLFAQLALRAQLNGAAPVLASLGRDAPDLGWFDATLSALARQRVAKTTSLAALLRSSATTDRAIVDAPESPDRVAQITQLSDRTAEIARLASAAAKPEVLTGRYRANLLAILATSWLADPVSWQKTVDESLESSARLLDDVRLAPMSDVQMFGGQVAIPITVINDLALPVTVRVQTVPSNARLVVDSDVVAELAAGSQTKVLVPVTARIGNGDVTVSITLFNEDLSVQLDGPEYVAVTVRADWESFGTLILGILVIGFFGIGIVRSLRRRRRGLQAAAGGEPTDSGKPDGQEEQSDQPR